MMLQLVQTAVGEAPLAAPGPGRPIARDPRSIALLAEAERIARSPATVLILGESGAGKEVFARFIHDSSPRAGGPFVAISAAAIPENLLEAELFGYERGAFSGADRAKPGRLEAAHGGTFLLDEIGELPLALQAKLLGALQPRGIDVRIIATTHRDLEAMVEAGTFRADLYYRLNVLRLEVPALRERLGDVLPLAEEFLTRASDAVGRRAPRFTARAAERLVQHTWPGNVRELMAVAERAAALAATDVVDAGDLRIDRPRSRDGVAFDPPATLADLERRAILGALDSTGGNREAAARQLGITSRTLRNKLKSWGLS
jgi:two-component system response regulator FlrC